jgi:hypothetical protein
MRQSRIDSRLFNWFNILVFEEKNIFDFANFWRENCSIKYQNGNYFKS